MRNQFFIKTLNNRSQYSGYLVLGLFVILFSFPFTGSSKKLTSTENKQPNIVIIVPDDLGWADIRFHGSFIKTPNIDRLAEQGMRFTQFYSGSPVCAPSRSVLMTGKHTGHTFIRDNKEIGTWESFNGQLPLPDNTTTLAELLKSRGYTTAAIGKWGLGYPGSSGDPNKQGFDLFFGYNCQRHAHNYYPEFLWKNDSKIDLEGNTRGITGKHYAPDLMEEEALNFISENHQLPFFLYFATTIPHAPSEAARSWNANPRITARGYLEEAPDVLPPRESIESRL